MSLRGTSFKTVLTFDKAVANQPLSPADHHEQSRLAAAPLAEAVATFERIAKGEATWPHPQVVRLLAERLVREQPGFLKVQWQNATSPTRLREAMALVIEQAVPVTVPDEVQTIAIGVSRGFVDGVNRRYANTPARMEDYADTPVEAWAAFAIYDVASLGQRSAGYPALLKTLDEMTAKKPDLAAAVLARREVREQLLLAYVSGHDKALIERLAKHTRAIAPLDD